MCARQTQRDGKCVLTELASVLPFFVQWHFVVNIVTECFATDLLNIEAVSAPNNRCFSRVSLIF